jgi:hypothetical protein
MWEFHLLSGGIRLTNSLPAFASLRADLLCDRISGGAERPSHSSTTWPSPCIWGHGSLARCVALERVQDGGRRARAGAWPCGASRGNVSASIQCHEASGALSRRGRTRVLAAAGHKFEDPKKIVDEALIEGLLERTKKEVGRPPLRRCRFWSHESFAPQAKDPARLRDILTAAVERATLKRPSIGRTGSEADGGEYVQGLTLEEVGPGAMT